MRKKKMMMITWLMRFMVRYRGFVFIFDCVVGCKDIVALLRMGDPVGLRNGFRLFGNLRCRCRWAGTPQMVGKRVTPR